MTTSSLAFGATERPTLRAWHVLAGGIALVLATTAAVAQNSASLWLALVVAGGAGIAILVRPELGVLVLTSTFFLSYPDALQGSGRFTINNILAVVLAGVLFVRVALERRADFLRSRQIQLLLLIGLLVLVNEALAPDTPAFKHLLRLDITEVRVHDTLAKLVFVVFVVAFLRTRRQIALLAGMVVCFVLMTAPGAISNALTAAGDVEKIRAQLGTADIGIVAARNANRLAFLCGIAIATIGFAMDVLRARWLRALALLAIGLLLGVVLLSASRSGLVSIAVVGVVFALRAWRRSRAVVPLLVTLTIGAGLGAIALYQVADDDGAALTAPRRSDRRGAGTQTRASGQAYLARMLSFSAEGGGGVSGVAGSTQARQELIGTGLRMAWDHPVAGVGLGNFRWVSVLDYGNRYRSAMHNAYLLMLVEGGLLILIPYLALFYVCWRDLRRARDLSNRNPQVGLGWLVESTRTMLVLFLVFSVFADIWHEVYLYLIVALSVTLSRLYDEASAGMPA